MQCFSNCRPHQLMQPQYCSCGRVRNRIKPQLRCESKSHKTPATERHCGRNIMVLWPQLNATAQTQLPHLNQPIVNPQPHSPSSAEHRRMATPTTTITAAHSQRPLQCRRKTRTASP